MLLPTTPFGANVNTLGEYSHPRIAGFAENSDRADYLAALACADTACGISKGRTPPQARPLVLNTPNPNERSVCVQFSRE